jgi:predicted dehydrogenase
MENGPVTAVIVGAGNRGMLYASYARENPEKFRIVGVVDPSPHRRRAAAEAHGIDPANCFERVEELVARPRMADAAINGTMDHLHVATSLPLLEAGYDLLLEKPFALNPEEARELVECARRNRRKVMICHVLRYAPFYAAIRDRVAAGEIGEVVNLQLTEHVSYHHMSTAFVRGKWNSVEACGSSMLMAKCCHDLDLLTWFKSGIEPVRVSSFGGIMQFRPDKAPEGAGTRCLVDCPIEKDCFYSAKKLYIDTPERWKFYVWSKLEEEKGSSLTIEEKIAALETHSPFGRCIWRCDNDVADHQTVAVEFADGATGTLNLMGGSARPSRCIHLLGTRGEIEGKFEDSRFVIRHADPRPGHEYTEEVIDLKLTGDMHGQRGGHGGGDMRLVADFVRIMQGEQPSPSCTSLEDSINGHLVGFAADEAMRQSRVVDPAELAPQEIKT